jgi:hypothetical protein
MLDAISAGKSIDKPARVLRLGAAGFLITAVLAGALQNAAAQTTQASAMAPGVRPQPEPAGSLGRVCAARPAIGDSFLAEVSKARDLPTPEAEEAALALLEPEARRQASELPNDVSAQYRLAAVMGAALDLEHGTSKMNGASELYDQVVRVLALDPAHPGANYMMGKIHASVMRLSGMKRFLANTLFGGPALKNASWEEAQTRLELAVREEPCVPEHHFELARVYAAKRFTEGWERELAYVVQLTAGQDGRQASKLRERSEGFAREWRDGAS